MGTDQSFIWSYDTRVRSVQVEVISTLWGFGLVSTPTNPQR